MAVAITLIRDRKGDQVMHVAGCGDIKRAHRSSHPDEAPVVYLEDSLIAAIRAADADMAGWFGEEPYTQKSRDAGCWTTLASEHAPCFVKALKADGISFDEVIGEPLKVVATRQYQAPSGQCRGRWSRCSGANPSKSATWHLCDSCSQARTVAMMA